jgi:N utilization substance protein B
LTRHESREAAVILLYECELGEFSADEALEISIEAFDMEVSAVAKENLNGVLEHKAELDEVIARLSPARTLSRISVLNLTILRLAVYEMLYCPAVPPKAALNEALDIAADFCGDSDKSFISGLLGTFYRERYE